MRKEATGERDPFMSIVHRLLAKSLWVMDIDFYEYTSGTKKGETVPLALIECKRNGSAFEHGGSEAFVALADRARLPAFVVKYWPAEVLTHARFQVVVLNVLAEDIQISYRSEGFKCFDDKVDAAEFEAFLLRLRGAPRSKSIITARRSKFSRYEKELPTKMVNYTNERTA